MGFGPPTADGAASAAGVPPAALQQQMRELEALIALKYGPDSDPSERAKATVSLHAFHTTADSIMHCQLLLDHSQSALARLFASEALQGLVLHFWNNFNAQQGLEVRNYVMNYLTRHVGALPPPVVANLVSLVAKITKLGWFVDPEHQQIHKHITRLLQHSVQNCILGVSLLCEVVTTMNSQLPTESPARHRKTAVAFRDGALVFVFRQALTTLNQIQQRQIETSSPQEDARLKESVLALVQAVLNFDHVGLGPDDASDDSSSLQLPSSWRPIIEDPATLTLFLNFLTAESNRAHRAACLEALVLLASVRRSIFAQDAPRMRFVSQLVAGTLGVLTTYARILDDEQCFHHFCRLLSRLKGNFHLKDLTSAENYEQWFEAVASFTIRSFQRWHQAPSSVHYLMELWSRIASALPFSDESAHKFDEFIPQVASALVNSRLSAVRAAVENKELDDLFQEPDLADHLSILPGLCRFRLDRFTSFFISRIDPVVESYRQLVTSLTPQVQASIEVCNRVREAEGQLAVAVYVIGAVTAGHTNSRSLSRKQQAQLEATLAARAFQTMSITDMRSAKTFTFGDLPPCQWLDLASLYFMQQFRASFVAQSYSPSLSSIVMSYTGVDIDREREGGGGEGGSQAPETVFDFLAQTLGPQTTVDTIVNGVVNKAVSMLKVWAGNALVLDSAITLLEGLSAGYFSSRIVARQDAAKAFMRTCSPKSFPFLDNPEHHKLRIRVFTVISRLLFDDENISQFEPFMNALAGGSFQALTQATDHRSPQLQHLASGLTRDLSGILQGAQSARAYQAFWEWLYPQKVGALLRLLETWWDEPDVATPVLKLFAGLCSNSHKRIDFGPCDSSNYSVFIESTKAVALFAERTLHARSQQVKNLYRERMQGICACAELLVNALSGDYINFGIFSLYGDKCFHKSLVLVLRMLLTLSTEAVLSYADCALAYFSFVELLFQHQPQVAVEAGAKVLLALLEALFEGLQSGTYHVTSSCCAAIDYLFTFRFRAMQTPAKAQFAKQIDAALELAPSLLPTLLSRIFNLCLFDSASRTGPLSRPLLALMVTDPQAFGAYKNTLIAAQAPQNREALAQAFGALMKDVKPNLENDNRNVFHSNIGVFRSAITGFCVKPS